MQAERPSVKFLGLGQGLAVGAFAGFCLLWARWQAVSPGVSKISGDFVSFWTAGQLALAGHATDAYREPPHMALQLALHGDPGWGYLAFFYPPFFLLLCSLFALIGYFPALVLWLVSTCAAYAAVMRALLGGRSAWVLLLGYPAVMVNAGFGQNGFLNAALLGAAALWLDRRPVWAGICLGCLAYKPQLGVIVPLALLAAGRWRSFASAALTVLALSVAATLVFGLDIWTAFFTNMADARRWMQVADPDYLAKWITVYGALRLHDVPLTTAYAAQAVVSLIAAFALTHVLWRANADGRAVGTAMAACAPFCAPFMLEYDLVILAVPMAWLLGEGLRDGFRRGECAALGAAYLAPALFKVTLFDNALKLTAVAAAAALFAAVLRRISEKS